MARKVDTSPFYGFSMNPFHLLIVVGITIGSYYLANTHWSFGKSDRPLRHYYPISIGMHDLDTIYEHIPPFSLIDQDSNEVSIQRKDKLPFILILTAYIPDADSVEIPKAQALQKVQEVIADVEEIRMLSVVLDTTIYTPSQLTNISQSLKNDEKLWSVVSGEWEEVYLLLNNGVHLGVDKDSLTVRHPERVVLIDKKGHTRGRYNGTGELFAEDLIADIKTLRKEYLPKE